MIPSLQIILLLTVILSMALPALFTEVPHDMTTQSGEDVEMACSFRGAGSPSSLEIQWWYTKDHRTGPKTPLKDATKISVVKVAGSNISHKLRLSSVKPSDEGTYECRVIDFSGSVAQRHHVRAYLHVEPTQGSDVRVHGSRQRSDQWSSHITYNSDTHNILKKKKRQNITCDILLYLSFTAQGLKKKVFQMLHFTILKRIPDHFFGSNEFSIFVDVALNRQVSVDVMG
uniref:V-set and transmembrane domain containing 2 like n=1 Tax=Hippocampus comes TaxID=109280 RepID=A0A3Q2XVU4_HIPCM